MRKNNYWILFTFTFLLLGFSGCKGSKDSLENTIVLVSRDANHLVNLRLDQTQGNNFFGKLFFANLSGKGVKFLLTEHISTQPDERYYIQVKGKESIYPVDVDSIASVGVYIDNNQIVTIPAVVRNIPENFDWKEANLIISNAIFE